VEFIVHGEMIKACRIFIGVSEGTEPFWEPTDICEDGEDSIKLDVK
jgi:hypothetical protein